MSNLRLFRDLYHGYYAVSAELGGGIGRRLNALRLACWCMADKRRRG